MRIFFSLILLGVLALTARAEPHVVGYQRFHAKETSAEGGAILYSELGCANCHGDSEVVVARKGPLLESLSSRVNYDWVLSFLNDPESGQRGSTMPAMMHGMSDEEVKAVMAYLSTSGKKLTFKPPRHANAEMGSALYHEKGCVACHDPSSDYQGPVGRGLDLKSELAVSFPDLKEKTSLLALEYFLSDTKRYRPDGRMPHFDLGREGAINVAAHLLDLQGTDPREAKVLAAWPKVTDEEIKLGREIVEGASCVACHDLPGMKRPEMIFLRGSTSTQAGGCLSSDPAKGLPRYSLREDQKLSLRAYLAKPKGGQDPDGVLTLKAMNCYACHDRDGLGGPTSKTDLFFHGEESLGDSGRLPPPLTGIGYKLRRDWLEGVLVGNPKMRVRPYLSTAMPSYPQQAKKIADWLVKLDASPAAKRLVEVPHLLEVGRKLLGTQGGMNCITCHNWGQQRSLGIPALDISSLNQRLRPEWFRSYLLAPADYRPGTLMPPLWPGGQSSIPGILGGDPEKQIASIWSFIAHGKGIPEGFPDRSSGQFELKPTTKPIVQRTFLEGLGTKAILVGFPEEIHVAFDGERGWPTLVWRGAFFDAYNTWFTRAAPFEKPLGKEVYVIPALDEKRRFRGYELDDRGVPTFLSLDTGRMIRERFEVKDGVLLRAISWEKGSAPGREHPKGLKFKEVEEEKKITITYQWK